MKKYVNLVPAASLLLAASAAFAAVPAGEAVLNCDFYADPVAATPGTSAVSPVDRSQATLRQDVRRAFHDGAYELTLSARVLCLDEQLAASVPSDAESNSDAELAKKLSNPVASLISVPLQYNADFNAGVSGHAHRSYLNIQPVIPIALNKDWNLITRTIIPVVYQEELAPGQGTNTGLGDVTASFFFSPKEPVGGWIVGFGPVAYLPTATDTALCAGQWGGGMTALALRQEKGWTYGMLVNHIWSIYGDDDRPHINMTFVQPFISYTTKSATTFSLNTESTYEWRNSQWTMPINVSVSQLVKFGGQPMQFAIGPRYYAEGPSGAPEWGMRFVVTFLFPK